jgi:hypothetical protein
MAEMPHGRIIALRHHLGIYLQGRTWGSRHLPLLSALESHLQSRQTPLMTSERISDEDVSPEERAKRLHDQSKDLYALLGEFVAKFQIICMELHAGILFMAGLRNESVMRAALADMTAQPLLNTYRSIASDVYKLKESQSEILLNVVNRVQALITKRNEILHGTWFIGWADTHETDFSSAGGLKARHTKDGVRQKLLGISSAEFEPLIRECDLVAEIVNRLASMATFGYDFSKNFIQADGVVSVPAHLSRLERK